MNLDNKVIIITGAARGFGQAVACEVASQGAHIVACDLGSCDETLSLISAAGGKASAKTLDVTDAALCSKVCEEIHQELGRIDGLVNNAALYANLHPAPFEHLDGDEWDAAMKVNVKGTWHMAKAVSPHMRAAKQGSIVNVASNTALLGFAYMAHYVASKAAVIGLSRTLATEFGPDNVRVNTVCPGAMNTPSTVQVGGDNLEAMLAAAPPSRLKALLDPPDVTGTIAFLLSDASAQMTGQYLTVDGGMTSN